MVWYTTSMREVRIEGFVDLCSSPSMIHPQGASLNHGKTYLVFIVRGLFINLESSQPLHQ